MQPFANSLDDLFRFQTTRIMSNSLTLLEVWDISMESPFLASHDNFTVPRFIQSASGYRTVVVARKAVKQFYNILEDKMH